METFERTLILQGHELEITALIKAVYPKARGNKYSENTICSLNVS